MRLTSELDAALPSGGSGTAFRGTNDVSAPYGALHMHVVAQVFRPAIVRLKPRATQVKSALDARIVSCVCVLCC